MISQWVVQTVLANLFLSLSHLPPNLLKLVRCEARQPEKSRHTQNKRVLEPFRVVA